MTDSLFSPDYAEPVDTSTQVERLPGTPDADCLCSGGSRTGDHCTWPFCGWKTDSAPQLEGETHG